MNRSRTLALAECTLMLAAAVALSYVKLFQLPFDGSITLLSMLPITLVAIRHGLGWGLGTAFAYSWFQILQGGVFAWGLTPGMLVASLLLDYLLAFTVLGLAGLFRRRGTVGAVGGVALVCVLRFLVHFLAGVILWANFEEFVAFGQEWVGRPWLYSLCYNGVYMLPETVFT
ncbi:MAG: energy-coupled thiamine transporter ThiT, partial [Clostridia bacterium]|nr:energy-coupled thiamine transporter ThiT [Clostridia bacterium]